MDLLTLVPILCVALTRIHNSLVCNFSPTHLILDVVSNQIVRSCSLVIPLLSRVYQTKIPGIPRGIQD